MHRVIRAGLVALPLVLAACLGGGDGTGAFRQSGAPIWSAASFDLSQAAGDWQQVAGFADRAGGCGAGHLRLMPEAAEARLSGTLCLNGQTEKLRGRAKVSGPGRLMIDGEEWWVLWVDSGYRTMAIGTPSGRFGIVLDRGDIPADRLQAAREVLEFNGFDVTRLLPF